MTLPLPRFVIAKTLGGWSDSILFFRTWKNIASLAARSPNQPLGRDYVVACGEDGLGGRAAALNAQFDEWQDMRRGLPITGEHAPIYGSIRWLFQEYRRSKAYTEKVSLRSRPDYERTMQLVEGSSQKRATSLAIAKSDR